MKHLSICLACTTVILSTPASAQRDPRWIEGRGAIPMGAEGASPEYKRMNDGAVAAWMSDDAERRVSRSYGMALQFAECVARFNRATAEHVLAESIAGRSDVIRLRRVAEANPGCALQYRTIHPLLLRAALAETLLEGKSERTPSTTRKPTNSVGVPNVVDGYPLLQISRCQVSLAPNLVSELLATEPGDPRERKAAAALFAQTASCGTTTLGRLTPTAARLALIDAAYSASVNPGAR